MSRWSLTPKTIPGSKASARRANVAEVFRPDVIVSQHGCDAHAYDPLSHIHCSMRIYQAMPMIIHDLAHRYADGRWIALGGGGYDIWRVVPCWALVWLAMTDHADDGPIERRWRERAAASSLAEQWAPRSEDPLPRQLVGPSRNLGSRCHGGAKSRRATRAIMNIVLVSIKRKGSSMIRSYSFGKNVRLRNCSFVCPASKAAYRCLTISSMIACELTEAVTVNSAKFTCAEPSALSDMERMTTYGIPFIAQTCASEAPSISVHAPPSSS